MANFRKILNWFLPIVLLSILLAGCAGRQIARVRDGQPVEFEQMVAELKDARVVFVGENHDVAAHHQIQFDVIKALHEAGTPLAIGLEMFAASSQRDLDQWVAGELSAGSFTGVFRENWRVTWRLYSEIFFYARDNHIPLVGLNITKEVMHKVYTAGFGALSEKERKGLPSEVSCDSGDPYTGFIQKVYVGHTADSGPFGFFCEAQTLWNKGMALNLVNYLKEHPDTTMVVLAGGGHVMKSGIPGQMKQYGDYPFRVILPDIPGLFSAGVTVLDADYFVDE
jgi:uncharacterized iron-regulated protein